MAEWYYSAMGQTKGPVSKQKLIDLILKDVLELESYVTDGMDKPWRKVNEFPELLEELHKPTDLPHVDKFPADMMDLEAPARVGNVYFYIPLSRLIIMSVLSLGLYQFYWMYKQWQYYDFKHRERYQRSRGGLALLFLPYVIFQNIQYDKELNEVERANFSGVGIFWLWIAVGLGIYLLTKSLDKMLGSNDLLLYALGSLDVLVLLPVQAYINRVNEKLHNTYDKPGIGHYVCLVLGLGTFFLTFVMAPLLTAALAQ